MAVPGGGRPGGAAEGAGGCNEIQQGGKEARVRGPGADPLLCV